MAVVPLKRRSEGIITGAGAGHWNTMVGFLSEGRNRHESSYVIFTDGTDTYAVNGTTGIIDYGGPNDNGGVDGADAAAVFNASIDVLGDQGGRVFARRGEYQITSAIEMKRRVCLEGEIGVDLADEGTVLIGAVNINVIENANPAVAIDSEIDRDIWLKNLTIRSQDIGTGVGLMWEKVRRANIFGVSFRGGGVARRSIYFKDCESIYLQSSRTTGGGLYAEQPNQLRGSFRVVNCGFHTNLVGAGIEFNRVWSARILGNEFDMNLHGLYLHDGCRDITISNNRITDNKRHGVYIYEDCRLIFIVGGNEIRDNSEDTLNTYDGVHIADGGTACQFIHVKNNNIRNYAAARMRYAIREQDLSDDNEFMGNDVFSATAPYISIVGADTRVKFNRGFVTENRGTATIIAANTAIATAHGCDYTPNVSDIDVKLTNQPTNDIGDVWIDTIGAANFTINCRNAPGVATAIFAWSVRRV